MLDRLNEEQKVGLACGVTQLGGSFVMIGSPS